MLGAAKAPHPSPATLIRGDRRPGRRAGWTREGRGKGAEVPGRGSGLPAAAAGGRLQSYSKMPEAEVLYPTELPWTLKFYRQLTGFGSHWV